MKKRSHGLGSYDRPYDSIESHFDNLISIENRAHSEMSHAWSAIANGSHGRHFDAKRKLHDVLVRLLKELESSRIAEATSGKRLDSLPRHAPFTKAHDLMREFRSQLQKSEKLKKKLVQVSYGGIDQMREGLSAERDKDRRRRYR